MLDNLSFRDEMKVQLGKRATRRKVSDFEMLCDALLAVSWEGIQIARTVGPVWPPWLCFGREAAGLAWQL